MSAREEPEIEDAAVGAGSHYAHLALDWGSFVLAVLAGLVITILTRMQHATESLGVQSWPPCCCRSCS